jgi:Zn-dependent protease with chaperone function
VVVVVVTGWLAFKDYAYLWGTFLTGLGLLVVGGLSAFAFRGLELSVRRHSDEIADVAAVQLARDPVSLAELLVRLAENDARVGPAPSSAEHLWFELVEVVPEEPDSILALSARVRTRRDLLDRAERAYAEARVPMPSEVRRRVDQWRREHASIS